MLRIVLVVDTKASDLSPWSVTAQPLVSVIGAVSMRG